MKKITFNAPLNHKAYSYEPMQIEVEKVITLYGKRFEQMRDHPLEDAPEIIDNRDLMYMEGNTAHCIETDRFFRYNMQNKLLMLDDDMQMTALPTTGIIKNLVTAEIPVDVEAKGQQSEQAAMYARFLCFGNGSPKALYDKSDGFARRLLILTTKQKPPNRIDDPYLAEKFIAEKEKIFCWMFDGLKRLIENKFRFTVSEKTKKNVAEVMADNCNIIEFLKDETFIRFGADFEASGVDLYGGYVLWCSRNALTALKKDTFIAWLHSNAEKYGIKYDTHIKNRNNERVRGFRGIRTSYVPILL